MFKIFRDRSIIAACLVLFALSMMVASLGQAQAKSIDNIEGITTFGVVCSGDFDGQVAEPHCPLCRLADVMIEPHANAFSPQIGWAFAVFISSEKSIVQPVAPNRFAPPRAPPFSS